MNSHAIGVYNPGMTADSGKVKSAFAFLDKVFHPAATAVKLNNLLWRHIHVCDNESIHVYHLTVRFFNLKSNTPRIILGTCLIHEFTVGYRIADLIFFCDFV